ncbi:MAG: ribbon-helix-helix protein, CopG family [Bdellovibrionota bacterium]
MPARTTIRMDEALLRKAKKMALDSGRSLTAFIEDAVREQIQEARTGRKRASKPLELPVVEGGQVVAPVDLRKTSAVLDWLEAREKPAIYRASRRR